MALAIPYEGDVWDFFSITHGEGMAVVLPAWVRYAAAVKPHMPARLAAGVFGGDALNSTEEELALFLSDKLTEFFRGLGLRTSLDELGIGTEHFDVMAARATGNDSKTVGHYIPLDSERFRTVLGLALKGGKAGRQR